MIELFRSSLWRGLEGPCSLHLIVDCSDSILYVMQAVGQGAPLTGPIAVGAMANMWLLLLWQIHALDAGKPAPERVLQ